MSHKQCFFFFKSISTDPYRILYLFLNLILNLLKSTIEAIAQPQERNQITTSARSVADPSRRDKISPINQAKKTPSDVIPSTGISSYKWAAIKVHQTVMRSNAGLINEPFGGWILRKEMLLSHTPGWQSPTATRKRTKPR